MMPNSPRRQAAPAEPQRAVKGLKTMAVKGLLGILAVALAAVIYVVIQLMGNNFYKNGTPLFGPMVVHQDGAVMTYGPETRPSALMDLTPVERRLLGCLIILTLLAAAYRALCVLLSIKKQAKKVFSILRARPGSAVDKLSIAAVKEEMTKDKIESLRRAAAVHKGKVEAVKGELRASRRELVEERTERAQLDVDHRAKMAELNLELDSYRESHVVHDDDVEQLKADIVAKGKHIDDLQGKLDALKKEYEDNDAKIEKLQAHLEEERRSWAETIASMKETAATEEKGRLEESRLKDEAKKQVQKLEQAASAAQQQQGDHQASMRALSLEASNDQDVLLVLYRSAGGATWRNKTNWGTDAELATWHGVKVDAQGRVLRLDLSINNLQGPIPPELGKLTALVHLHLWDNQLSGPVPKELGALSRLENLWLYNNSLTGHIPPELGDLSELQNLLLNGNELTGHIPPQLGQLGALQYLSLSNNELYGPIPEELGKLTALQQLYLHRNKLSGPIPPELGNLAALVYLALDGNELSGHIPPQLGQLGALQSLHLSSNKLDGPIPPELGELAALTVLSLASNQLTGPIPPELGNLAALQSLGLVYNELSGGPNQNESLTAWRTRLQAETG